MSYTMTYLLSNAIRTYLIYRLLQVFFDRRKCSAVVEFIIYAMFWVVVSAVYLQYEVPLITFLVNAIFILFIVHLYVSGIGKRLFAAAAVYVIPLAVESAGVFFWGYRPTGMTDHTAIDSSIMQIIVQLMTFAIVLAFEKFINIRKGEKLPFVYWLALISLPAVSVLIIITLMPNGNILPNLVKLTSFALMITNVLIFYLYDYAIAAAVKQEEAKTNEKLLAYEYRRIADQAKIIEAADNNVRNKEHDMNKHLSTLMLMGQEIGADKIVNYIGMLLNKKTEPFRYIKTGNVYVDGALNPIAMDARQYDIKIKTKFVGLQLNPAVDPDEWTTIIGNLMENAVEATKKETVSDKEIIIEITYIPDVVEIIISNTFTGNLVTGENEHFPRTSKDSTRKHGRGLKLVDTTVKRYSGHLSVTHEETYIKAYIRMYIGRPT